MLPDIKTLALDQRLEYTQGLSLESFAQKHFGFWWPEVLANASPFLYIVNPEYFGQKAEELNQQSFYAIGSTAVFTRSERVSQGEPILSPTAFLDEKGLSTFILTSQLYQYFQTIQDSFVQLAVWGSPKPMEQLWNRIPKMVATPDNVQRFATTLRQYFELFEEIKREGGYVEEIYLQGLHSLAHDLGMLGFWQEIFGFQLPFADLMAFEDEPTSEVDLSYPFLSKKTVLELDILGRFSQARKVLTSADRELVDLGLPVCFVFKRQKPIFYLPNLYGLENLDLIFDKNFPMRPPCDTACLPGGLYPNQVEKVLIDASISDHDLARINQILASWHCPKAERTTTENLGGIADCKIFYQQKPFSVEDFSKATGQKGLIRIIGDPSYSAEDGECLYDRNELKNTLSNL